MLRVLQLRSLLRLFSTKDSAQASSSSASQTEYLLFPTAFPVSPYYIYSARINKHYYQLLQKYNVRHMVAMPIRPGVYRRNFFPHSLEDLEKQLGLSGHNWSPLNSKHEVMSIMYNNVLYDGPVMGKQEAPVRVVSEASQLYPIGTFCSVNLTNESNNPTIYLKADVRLEAEWTGPPGSQVVSLVSGRAFKAEALAEVTRDYEELLQLYSKIREISTVNLPFIDVQNEKVPLKVAEFMSGYLCTLSYFSQDQLYQVFQQTDINAKISLLLRYYRDYFKVLQENWTALSGSGREDDKDRQREAVSAVYENMKRIVGNPGEQKFVDKIRQRLRERTYPEAVRKLVESELVGLESESSHDASRKKHYITLLTEYPFGILAKEEFDIKRARQILEEDHYGMAKLKQRILEFIAVSKLRGEFKSKVLLLYGPPGVGKTSIVKSIAKCLGRPYARVSLGGEYDTSIVKGHRKTYVGAYPGKIWDCIYKSKAENPVILLDQIDKIMARGNGASLQDAVMEVLDPVQNHRFKDDFMDVQIDLSRVLFICTANSLDTIFPPLLDRLQRIEVAGYTTIEKLQIFKRYILPQAMQDNGLPEELKNQLQFPDRTAQKLIEGYCKEAGVRNLVRKTNQIFQKLAFKHVKNIEFPKTLMPEHLKEFIGLETFHESRLFPAAPPVGVMIGLAYNNYGGSIMYIECANQGRPLPELTQNPLSEIASPSNDQKGGSLLVTGNIHDVMKESCQLAYTYAKYISSTFFSNHYLETNDVHLNFPQIEIGKDGPSAGVAITSALLSLAINKPAIREIAMTGEITLAGRVSAIGGVKEKTMGAKRQGITALIFPQDNRKDVEELQAEIRQGITFYFASHYFQVMELLFGIRIEQNIKIQDAITGTPTKSVAQSLTM